ncbi:P-loop containing nucleoside triphosphate hydrolase protein [Pholiota molesta]|nr:P-loop containing nucleoside triphosphate hydrolase protein [Pholiota molesta]
MVSPLIALQEEQVRARSSTAYPERTFREEYKLTAKAINSAQGGCTLEIMADICKGKWQIVIISPEMMLSKRFIKHVLRNSEMRTRVLSVVVDEAHVVSHWGSGFRKKYGTLGILRALLPKDTSMVAMSATLPDRVRRDVLKKLHFDEQKYTYLNLGNDRPNVSIVVRAIQNNISSYTDLDFLIPSDAQTASNVKKTFVYSDNITVGSDMMEHLYEISPVSLRDSGAIRTYSSAFSSKYRREVMELFKAGIVRILICTDAAGMGCNIPDIDVVVQWKLPSTVSSFVQRAGRAARGTGRTGLAVLLVEKSAYDLELIDGLDQNNGATRKKKGHVRESTTYMKSKDKNYGVNHGVLRGAFGGATDSFPAQIDVPLDRFSMDEGLHSLVQTTTCRRRVLMAIYGNGQPAPTVACCDICEPSLLDQTRPAPPSRNSRKRNAAPGMVDKDLRKSIFKFRKEIWQRDFGDSLLAPSAILSDASIDSLSSFGKIDRLIDLESALGGYWAWFDRYGDELLALFRSLDVAPKQAKSSKPRAARAPKRVVETVVGEADEGTRERERASKRTAEVALGGIGGGSERREQTKRQRPADSAGTPPTPVIYPRPGPSTSLPPSTPSTPFRPIAPQMYGYPRHMAPAYSSPLAHNPYASLATPPMQYYQTPQTPYSAIPFPYSHYYPANISSSSSQQVPDRYNIPYQYPRFPPGPPPAPPST